MDYIQDILPISQIKANAAGILKQVNQTKRPVVITLNGRARGILVDPDSYSQNQRALSLLQLIAQGEEDIRRGRIIPHEKVMIKLKKIIDDAKKVQGDLD